MDKNLLKRIILDQKETVEARMQKKEMISRQGFFHAPGLLRRPNVLLISGLRRAGKSVLSHQIAASMKRAALNFDDERLFGFTVRDFDLLLTAFYELFGEVEVFLFDEIQNIMGWELFINRIRDDQRIIITGSNAHLLSSELSTHLTGRYDALTLFPMSWREFLSFVGVGEDPSAALSTRQKGRLTAVFERYVQEGGIFEYHTIGKEHIRSLFSSIIHKDIFGRYALAYPHVMEELALLMVNSVASKLSVNNLAGHLKVKSPHTIKEYLGYLEDTFLLFTIEKMSYKLRERQSAAKKAYIADNGIIDALSFEFSSNRGRLLENAVAIELARRSTRDGSRIYYWDDYQNECDFILKKGTRIAGGIQVCHDLTERNIGREKRGLVKAMEEFSLKEGLIITADQSNEEEIDGKLIRTVPFYQWAS
jgi:hypothetical protein